LCGRLVYLKNSYEDLSIKKAILEREQARCNDRCKYIKRLSINFKNKLKNNLITL